MFKRKKKNNDLESYEEDIMNLATKEEEIMKSYDKETDAENSEYEYSTEEIMEDDSEYEYNPEETTSDYYDEYEGDAEDKPKREINAKLIINITFILIMVILSLVTIDVISVARYDKGPFFAIPLKKYADGGTKVYYGFGYKVIKYHQIQGRRDNEIGLWNLKYNIEPITLEDIDLAIEINGKETKTYKKYYKKFVRIISTLDSVDKENKKITINYKDEGRKYSLDMICSMEMSKSELSKLKENEKITIIGTVKELKHKTKKTPTKLYLENCFAEQ